MIRRTDRLLRERKYQWPCPGHQVNEVFRHGDSGTWHQLPRGEHELAGGGMDELTFINADNT